MYKRTHFDIDLSLCFIIIFLGLIKTFQIIHGRHSSPDFSFLYQLSFSFSAFSNSILMLFSPAVLSTHRFRESDGKGYFIQLFTDECKILDLVICDLPVPGNLDQAAGKWADLIQAGDGLQDDIGQF